MLISLTLYILATIPLEFSTELKADLMKYIGAENTTVDMSELDFVHL